MSKLPIPINVSELKKMAEEKENPTLSFYDAVESALGLSVPHAYEDGEIHRFGPKGCCWYVLHRSRRGTLYGHFGDWRNIEKEDIPYCSRGKIEDLPESEKAEIRLMEEKRKAEEEKYRKERLKEVTALYNSLPQATSDHPYLIRKGVTAQPDMRLDQRGNILVPMYNFDGEMRDVQYLFPKADENGKWKSYARGLLAGGLYYPIPGDYKNTFICEGVATGLSIHAATGATVICAMSAGNMPKIAENYPRAIIVADNDANGAGEEAAKKCEHNNYYLIPNVGMDANDYATAFGNAGLLALLSPLMEEQDYSVPLHTLLTQPTFSPYLIKGWFSKGQLGACVGASGSGKTFVLLDMMLTLCCGLPYWHEYKTPGKKLNIYYLCGEGFEGVPKRVMAWLITHPDAVLGNINITRSPKNLDKVGDLETVISDMKRCRDEWGSIDLIVIDTYNQFNSGDENAADSVHAFLENIGKMRDTFGRPCTILSHHTGVGENAQKRGRGSSAFKAALDFEFLVEKGEDDDGTLTLSQTKQKDIECLQPIGFKLNKIQIGWKDEDGEEITSAVISRDKEDEWEGFSFAPAFFFDSLFQDEWITRRNHFYARKDGCYIVPKKDMREYCTLYYRARYGKDITLDTAGRYLKNDREIGLALGDRLNGEDKSFYLYQLSEKKAVEKEDSRE